METGYKFPIHESNIYKMWELEKQEINKLKWIESEKVGYDIGWSRAEWLWWGYYKIQWVKGMRESGFIG
jgi:hypothetical protein